jgi:CRP-like cAMP-binding protein
MKTSDDTLLPAVRLEYPKGELIVKEGDYGVSIYQIIEGKVGVFVKSGEQEILVSTLGSGEFIGEMIFLTGHKTRRSASVRALEASVLEAWHPSRITQEYEAMPFIIRHFANQAVDHLVRTNQTRSKFTQDKKEKKAPPPKEVKKRAYGKIVDIDCLYRPFDSSADVRLWSRVKEIGNRHLKIDVRQVNTFDYSHNVGDEFLLIVYLPNKNKVKIKGKIGNSKTHESNRLVSVDMEIVEVSKDTKRNLTVFLL